MTVTVGHEWWGPVELNDVIAKAYSSPAWGRDSQGHVLFRSDARGGAKGTAMSVPRPNPVLIAGERLQLCV